MRTRGRSFATDQAGAITPITAMTLAAMLGMAGLVTDVGVWYVQRRSLQSATDAAALAAANRPGDAQAIAGQVLALNGYDAATLVSAESGYYCPDAGLAPEDRFSTTPCAAGAAPVGDPNAVRLTTAAPATPLLSKVVPAAGAARVIRPSAIGTRIDEAGLQIGSGLASADLAVSNAVLQSLVGGSGLSLTAVQYDGLISTQVDALTFFDALASRLNVTGGTYGELLDADVAATEVIQASIDALDGRSDAAAAVAGLAALKAKITGSPQVSLGSLFDLGVWRDIPLGASGAPAALSAGLNAYQIAAFTLQLMGQSQAVVVPTSTLGVPGLVGATIAASAIEPPQSAYFAFGPEGISVHTAQVRLRLTLQAVGGLLALPLYVEVAQGTAELVELGCGAEPGTDAWADVETSPGVATLYLGNVPAGAVSDFGSPTPYANVTPTPLLNISVLGLGAGQVRARAVASAAPPSPTLLTFTRPPDGWSPDGSPLTTHGYIARTATATNPGSPGLPAEAVTSDALAGLTGELWDSLSLSACVLNCTLTVSVPALATSTLNTVLNPLLNGLDPLIDGILSSLGVKVGRAEVLVTGVRCGVPVLVK